MVDISETVLPLSYKLWGSNNFRILCITYNMIKVQYDS